jgi:hypothetical protein
MYKEYTPDKNWDAAPKVHMHKHLFDDIQNKGVTRNFNTKPNEKAHGLLKTFYKLNTNFKDVASQVMCLYSQSSMIHLTII